MSEAINLSDLEALRLEMASADIHKDSRIINTASVPEIIKAMKVEDLENLRVSSEPTVNHKEQRMHEFKYEITKNKRSQAVKSVSNSLSFIDHSSHSDGKPHVFSVSITVVASHDGHESELAAMQAVATEFISKLYTVLPQ